jgi:hypothetical protein
MRGWFAAIGFFAVMPALQARPADSQFSVVSHVKVVSGNVEDVSSLDAWKRSFIKDGMNDQQKAMAIWESVLRFRHQEIPPNEFLQNESHPHDPIKDFNVYGYGQCFCASANIEALARYAGLPARGWGIIGHSVPEVQYDGKWHMLDASLLAYFPKAGADGSLAGVQEIAANIDRWYKDHPQFKGDEQKLLQFSRDRGWKNGPELLAACPTYDQNGWLPAGTHGWYSTMQEYADPKKTFLYEYGTALGYEVNVQLCPGERLTRNWFNKGLHVNALEGGANGSLNAVVGKDQYTYAVAHGDLAPGRIGNGTLEYDVGPWRKAEPLEVRMPCSYVYLGGEVTAKATVPGGGEIAVAFSDNNGLDWTPLATITTSGAQRIDLKPLVYRRYDYRLRFTFKGGAALDDLKITQDVQHSQRALPALAQGSNTITFTADEATMSEGTIVVEPGLNPEFKGKNLQLEDFHPQIHNLFAGPVCLTRPTGDLTLPIATPGDMSRLRIGAHYRARDARDGWDVQASFDEGQAWKPIGRLAGPTAGNSAYFVFADVPPGTRKAMVRLAGQQRNTTCLFDLRISADYVEPAGTFAPVKVTYVWEEGGVTKRDVHLASKPREVYTIQCALKPLLRSLIVEREK